ncbi:MAG TPA: sensor histidine kinase [Spirochaetia bacterium]|nr:sensor histidine kinase [Spirochaetia bacterium]
MTFRPRDLSIRHKLFITFFLLVLLFLCVFLLVNTLLSVRENERQALRSARRVFAQTEALLDYKTESVRNLLYLLATNPVVQDLLERRPSYYRQEIGRWPIDSQALGRILYSLNVNPDITAVRFYMKYGLASVFQNDSYVPLDAARNEPWLRALSAERRTAWFLGEPSQGASTAPVLHAVRGVYGTQDLTELIGVIQFDIPLPRIADILANAVITESATALLVGANGDVVSSAGAWSPAAFASIWDSVRSSRQGDFTGESWLTLPSPGGKLLVGTQGVADSDWILLLALPSRDIVRLSARPARQMAFVLALIIPLTLVLAYVASRSATRRIQGLIAEMNKVVQGDFSVSLDPGNNDEIGQLTRRFAFMVSEVEQLLDEKYRLGKEVKQRELKALQAQINPHFLYNTLDLVNWMAIRRDAPEIRSLVSSLSRFYKLSLGRGEDTVTLRDELDHARTYVEIQNMRFGNAIRLLVDVPPSLDRCPILKLVIQPLVENAILHGIMPTESEKGTIRISGQTVDSAVVVSVQDDGVGMSAEKLQAVLSGDAPSQDHHGFGVRNIHSRLQLSYGPGFGLSFHSTPNGGTTVVVRVPAA